MTFRNLLLHALSNVLRKGEAHATMNWLSPSNNNPATRLHEVLFSLNLAFGLVGPWLMLALTFCGTSFLLNPVDGYLFRRAAIRIHSFLPEKIGFGAGAEVAIAATLISCAILILVVLRSLQSIAARDFVLTELAGLTALFGVPLGLLYVVKVTWDIRDKLSFWSSAGVKVFVFELACFGFFLMLRRRCQVSRWAISFLLLLHFIGWSFLLWSRVSHLMVFASYDQSSPHVHMLFGPAIFAASFPLSGVAWLLYIWQTPSQTGKIRGLCYLKKAIASSLAAIIVLGVMWLPGKGYGVSHSENIKSLRVVMKRTKCYGTCPEYSVTVTGDGAVEYNGIQFVSKKGRQTANISSDQVVRLAEDLDRIIFFALEDKAFLWCYDTPRVSVSVSVDGRTKAVSSDGYCTGRASGHQAEFIRVTQELDQLVDSGKWVDCIGRCRR